MCISVLLLLLVSVCLFKQKTAYELRISDWSSDVCSSDVAVVVALQLELPAGDAALAVGLGEGREDARAHAGAERRRRPLERGRLAEGDGAVGHPDLGLRRNSRAARDCARQRGTQHPPEPKIEPERGREGKRGEEQG